MKAVERLHNLDRMSRLPNSRLAIGWQLPDIIIPVVSLMETSFLTAVECDDCKNTGIQYRDFKGGKPGITMDGNFAEYLLADSNNVLPLPKELDFTDVVSPSTNSD